MLRTTSCFATRSHRLRRVFLTAAAALSTSLPAAVEGFSVRPAHFTNRAFTNRLESPNLLDPRSRLYTPTTRTTRLYSSSKPNGSLFKRIASKVLPKSWVLTEEEQKAELARKERKDVVKGGIKELLKDAPLPVRMMGSMVAPLLSRVASDLSESMAEQQRTVETVLEDARSYIIGDDLALQALGEPIQVGTPFSQSSSTSVINGQKTTNIALGFPVEGSKSSGVAQAQANQNGITQLVLQVEGRQIHIDLSHRGSLSSSSSKVGKNHRTMKSYEDDDNIIEAEIIEKDVKK